MNEKKHLREMDGANYNLECILMYHYYQSVNTIRYYTFISHLHNRKM